MKTPLRTSTALTTLAAILYFVFPVAAQSTITKLEISKRDVYVVDSTNVIRVDTLIMHDKASIQFDPGRYGMLEARVAIIGDDCIISSKGAKGKPGRGIGPGEDGDNGGHLSVILRLEKLGKLTLDLRGGDGGDGINGKHGKPGVEDKVYNNSNGTPGAKIVVLPGEPGTDGTDATTGGSGGHGGKLLLMYSSNGFTPVFNQKRSTKNSIIVFLDGGTIGRKGTPGRGGRNARDGIVREYGIRSSRNGVITLTNLNIKDY